MKIEKMNDHQIRCTLTQEDLASRQIKLSELAYGSEKTKLLFRDMMQQAANEFGFEADNIPLMIEAIPLSPEKIVLIITKVESPDELDTRFSNFTQLDEDIDFSDSNMLDDDSVAPEMDDTVADLLQIFQQIKSENQQVAHSENASATQNTRNRSMQTASGESDFERARIYRCSDLDHIISAAHLLQGCEIGENSLYRDNASDSYRLILKKTPAANQDFNRINHLLSGYLDNQKSSAAAEAYCLEHMKPVILDNALQTLASI